MGILKCLRLKPILLTNVVIYLHKVGGYLDVMGHE
jgi:hypothetical protein